MTTPRWPLLVAAVALVWGAQQCARAGRAAEREGEARAYADSVATEALLSDLRADSLSAALAVRTSDLAGLVRDRDEWRATAERLEAAHARIAATVDVEVEAEGRIEVAVEDSVEPGRYRGMFLDGPLAGRVESPVPLPWLGLDWTVRMPLAALLSWAPDGRPLLAVKYVGPPPGYGKVEVGLMEFRYEPPPVVEVRGPSRLRWLLAGVAVGVVGWELAR